MIRYSVSALFRRNMYVVATCTDAKIADCCQANLLLTESGEKATRSPLQQLAEGLYPARSAMDLQAASL